MNLNVSIKIFNKEYKLLNLLMGSAVILIGLVIRLFLFSYISGDYTEFLSRWENVLRNEGFSSLKDGWYNYTPLYMYVLLIIAKLPVYDLYAIKLFSVVFDLLLAFFTAKATRRLNKQLNPLIVFSIVWLAPTVIANSSMWGQCDSIYVFLIVLSIIYIFADDSLKAMICFSIAFALKLQSIFFAPVLILLFFLKKIKFWEFFLVPAAYFLSIIPIWIAGRPLKECLLIYKGQAEGKTAALSINYPNIYYLLLNDAYIDLYKTVGVIFTVCVLLVLMYHILSKCYENGFDNDIILQTALVSGSIIVFLLPGMHERYSYLVDIIAIIYAFTRPKKFYVPLLRIFISFIAYQTYFVYGMYFNYEILAAIQIFLIYDAVMTLYKTLNERKDLA
jgi:Gpi18-like mannosyltransferase